MADYHKHCEMLVREEDRDRFLAALFAPERYRPALFALYAFALETARVAHVVKEPMAGEIRLQWWHDVVTGVAHTGGSPVATALIDAMREFSLPEARLVDVIEAQREALQPELGNSETRAMRTEAPIFDLAARILNDGQDADIARLCDDAGAALSLMRTMPADEIARAVVAGHLSRVGGALSKIPERLWPAFLPLAPIRASLARAGRALPRWRRQWIIWRAARNLPAALGSL